MSIKKANKKQENKESIITLFKNAIFFLFLVLSAIIVIKLSYQTIFFPNKIPDVFGYKMYMVLNKNMVENLKYGDLVFSKNIKTNKLKEEDIVAFRNKSNTVTFKKIKGITESEDNSKIYIMDIYENETLDNKYVKEENIEGILKVRIPKIGLWIMLIQRPIVTCIAIIITVIVGGIAYYIAGKLDEKDAEELKKQSKKQKK